jgi:hypothetical protein
MNKGCLPLKDQFPKALLIGEIMAVSEPVCGRTKSAEIISPRFLSPIHSIVEKWL